MCGVFDIAVCIVLKNSLSEITAGLPRVLAQRVAMPFEVIVVDSGSTDGSTGFVQTACESSDNVRLVRIEPTDFHHARTRDFAAGLSKARYVVFLNGDAVPANEQWLERLMAPLVDSGRRIALSYSRQLCRADVDTNNACRMAFNYGPRSSVKGNDALLTPKQKHAFSTVSCCIDTQCLPRPLFLDDLPVNEDLALAARAVRQGLKLAYCAESVVYHSHNYGYFDMLRRSFDNAAVFHRLGFFDEPGPGIARDGLHYLRGSLASLCSKGIGAQARFLLFFACTATGAFLGKHRQMLPRWLAKHLSVYGTS